ncbi:MAG: hypothetical protein WCX31_19195 [Salinivirgaceae bacterium]
MKKSVSFFLVSVFLSALITSCTKSEDVLESTTLKQTISESASNLNNAMDAISSSKAYTILTISDGTQKDASITDSTYRVYIPLDSIKGVYDYQPVTEFNTWGTPLIKFFTQTEDNNQMVVNMPVEKVENPRTLRHSLPEDSLLTNNFSIAVSAYHNNYNSYHDFDYILASEISIDDLAVGNLNIDYFVSPTDGIQYASEFAFNGSYAAKYNYQSGDTTVSSFAIQDADVVLYKEELLTIKNDTAWFGSERQYSLTIGDVQIIRKPGTLEVEVYVNGVLQPNAVVVIIDNEFDAEASVCKKRDIQITFEDGTTTTVSALIGESIANIKTLFESLHQVYFAAYVVDWIAYDIYYQRN